MGSSIVRNIMLIILAILITYACAFRGAFQFDDYNVIVSNQRVHDWSAWWHDISTFGIRPLLKMTYVLDWVTGWGVTGFHITNLVIHISNAILVYFLTRSFLQYQPIISGKSWIPLLAALIFALHPMQTEAVTYISGRSSALMTLFYLGGLLAYSAGREKNNAWILHVAVPACMVMAMLCKETAVTYPAALMLWELLCGGTFKKAIERQWMAWLMLVLGCMFFLLHAGYAWEIRSSLNLNTLGGNLATQLQAEAYLMRQWFIPLWPNIDPDLPILRDFSGQFPHILILLGMITLMLYSWQLRPWLSFALAWLLLQILPLYLILPRLDVANDRQLYIVCWPLAMAVAVEIGMLNLLRTRIAGTGILLAILIVVTFQRNLEYRSEIALWESTASLSPEKARVQNNLGYAYMQAGRKQEAQHAFEKALKLDPEFFRARFNLKMLDSGFN